MEGKGHESPHYLEEVYAYVHNVTSELKEISASVVQGSAIGPASYVVNTSDLKVVHAGNVLCKYVPMTRI